MAKYLQGAVRAVLFDFDGTLTRPGALDFLLIRREIGCPAEKAVLEFIETLEDPEKERALSKLDQFEYEAACKSEPNIGAESLIAFLKARNIPFGLASRNSRRSVLRSLRNLEFLVEGDFSVLITRETPLPPKPNPAPVLWAAEQMKIPVSELLVVGDYVFDIAAGKQAGAPSVLLTNGQDPPLRSPALDPDYTARSLSELEDLIAELAALPLGKFPNSELAAILERLPHEDPSLLLAPEVGEDVCAVQLQDGDRVLVLTTDPVTFATDELALYSVAINANDVATAGARPRWFLSTLLLPEGTTVRDVKLLFSDLEQYCRKLGLTLTGGHTEITDVVVRPVISGVVAGTVERDRLFTKKSIREGDQLLLTKAIAIEGTSILAREFPAELERLGVEGTTVSRWQKLLLEPGISILKEAAIAKDSPGVRAMHDVTEGGVATALLELSHASNHQMLVNPDSIPVLPETSHLCRLANISPWGLIASGSLLIAVDGSGEAGLTRRLREAGIPVRRIGEVLGSGVGVRSRDPAYLWPDFEADEIIKASLFLKGAPTHSSRSS